MKVLNVPLPVTGTVQVAPTSTPFFQASAPTCDVINRCYVMFPVVAAGKLLRVTRITGSFVFQSGVAAFALLDLDALTHPLMAIPLVPFNGAFLRLALTGELIDVP